MLSECFTFTFCQTICGSLSTPEYRTKGRRKILKTFIIIVTPKYDKMSLSATFCAQTTSHFEAFDYNYG